MTHSHSDAWLGFGTSLRTHPPYSGERNRGAVGVRMHWRVVGVRGAFEERMTQPVCLIAIEHSAMRADRLIGLEWVAHTQRGRQIWGHSDRGFVVAKTDTL